MKRAKPKRLFFNHHLKDKKSKEPKAVVLSGGQLVYCNQVQIRVDGKVIATLKTGQFKSPAGHDVRAWLEVDDALDLHLE